MFEHLFDFQGKDVLFVCSSPIDEVWVRTTALRCHSLGLRVKVAICGARSDCPQDIYEAYQGAGIEVVHGITLGAAARTGCKLAVTASSGLDRTIFPTRAKFFIHMPHSLASLHMIYPADAFDGYDMLFSAGPQHEREFAAISSARGLSGRRTFAIGYGKLDVLAQRLAARPPRSSKCPVVLLAPSWGRDNLLDRCGVNLARSLAAGGVDVVVRPHPLFFLDKAPVLDNLRTLQDSTPSIRLESPFTGDEAIFDADVLVGDYSGTGFEFAALRRRPVISVDVGLKEANSDWMSLGLSPVEIACRNLLGPVVPPNVEAIVAAVKQSVSRKYEIADEGMSSFLYGPPGSCAERAAAQIQQLLIAS